MILPTLPFSRKILLIRDVEIVYSLGMENAETNIYGYARVSSKDQNIARQIIALTECGVKKENIYIDHQSGKDFDRPSWKKLKKKIRCGDLLVLQSLDRLGRNYNDMLDEWRDLVRRRKVDIKILNMPILDTANKEQGLVGTVISEIVLQLLSFVAENERQAIRERQRQGIEAAKLRGVSFGRPRRPLPPQFNECLLKVRSCEMTVAAAARICNVPDSTFREMIARSSASYSLPTLPMAKANGEMPFLI